MTRLQGSCLCGAVSYEIRRQLVERPEGLTTTECDAVFVRHHVASVSPIWFDGDGRPVDAWRSHFRVTFGGEDRQFGTSDDLSFEARER